jgi:hypothetical protein
MPVERSGTNTERDAGSHSDRIVRLFMVFLDSATLVVYSVPAYSFRTLSYTAGKVLRLAANTQVERHDQKSRSIALGTIIQSLFSCGTAKENSQIALRVWINRLVS